MATPSYNIGCAAIFLVVIAAGLFALIWPLLLAGSPLVLLYQARERVSEAWNSNGKARTAIATLVVVLVVLGVGGEGAWTVYLLQPHKRNVTNFRSSGAKSGAGSANPSSDSGDPSRNQHLAFSACERFVLQRLKVPSTATFRDAFANGDTIMSGADDGPYVITSSVDSENIFGLKLRSRFVCTVTRAGTDSWSLDDLRIDGPNA